MSLMPIKACATQSGGDHNLEILLEKICDMLEVLLDLDIDLDELATLTECLAELKDAIEQLNESITNIETIIENVESTLTELLECCANNTALLEALLECCASQTAILESLLECCEGNTALLESILECCTNNTALLEAILECCANNTTLLEALLECCVSNTALLESILECCTDNTALLESILECCLSSDALLEALLECCAENTAILESLLECCEAQTEILESILEKLCDIADTNLTLGAPCCVLVAGVWIMAQATLDGRWFVTGAGGLVEVTPEGFDGTGVSCLIDLSGLPEFDCDADVAPAPIFDPVQIEANAQAVAANAAELQGARAAEAALREEKALTEKAAVKATDLISRKVSSIQGLRNRLEQIRSSKTSEDSE